MSDFDFTNTEEALQNLRNQPKKNEQAYARKALSETLGIDFDKLAAFIEDNTAEQTDAETADEQAKSENNTLLPDDMFGAKDLNGIYGVYRASEFNIGAVITIKGVEFFKAVVPHDDHTHYVWISVMGRMLTDDELAETARDANATNNTNVTKIIHFG